MRRLGLVLAILWSALAWPAHATDPVACKATAGAPTFVEGAFEHLSCDLEGKLRTTSVGGGGGDFDGILRDGSGDASQANVTSGRLHVSGPLTDTELRAAPVEVTGSGAVVADSIAVRCVNAANNAFESCAGAGGSGDGIVKDGSGDTTEANVSSGRLHVDGSGVTQPVSGTVTVQDGGGAITVDGTVTVTDGAGNLTVDGTVTANQGGAPWSVAGPAADGAAVSGNPVRVGGKDGSGNTQDIATDTSGELQVDVLTLPSVTVGTFPDNEPFNVAQINGVTPLMGAGNTGTGSPRVTIATDQAALVGLGIYTEDNGETAGGNLAMSGTVRRDTAASSAGTSGDNATLNTDATGLLWTRQMDPCSALAKTYLPVNISTATTTEITPSLAGASNHYYVCSLALVTAGANNVALVDDDSDGCGSVTSGLAGGTTAGSGFNLAANGGLTIGNGAGSVFRTGGTNRVLCLVTSAATQLSGTLTVVAAP
jgi:hypothetical protein